MQNISHRVLELRQKLGLSQDAFAKLMHYTRTHISLVERGKSDGGQRFILALDLLEKSHEEKNAIVALNDAPAAFNAEDSSEFEKVMTILLAGTEGAARNTKDKELPRFIERFWAEYKKVKDPQNRVIRLDNLMVFIRELRKRVAEGKV